MPTARICIVSPEFIGPFPNGGVGTACYWEAHTLGAAGYDVTVLYTGPTERESPEHWEAHFAKTAPFRYVDMARATAADDIARLARYEHPCAEARTSELVLAWLRRRHFDLVLFQEFLGHGARALQARRGAFALDGTRTATTIHSCRQWIYEGMHRLPQGLKDLAVDFLEKESTCLADCVIAPSSHMAQWATAHWHLATDTAVIPYCYDARLAQARSVVEHAGPFRHLVFFGRLETRKGLHLLCRALIDTPDLREHVEQVTFLGKPSSVDGRPSEEFIATQMAKAPGVQWNILGTLGSFEAQSWLASQPHVLVVAPSLVDNLPYAVIELYTRRLPFVATDIGGIPEIVGEANRHLLARPAAASLAGVIGRVCRDGRLVVDYRSGYDVAAANDAHVAFIGGLLAGPASRAATARNPTMDVVVTNLADDDALADLRERVGDADITTRGARWVRVEEWQGPASGTPALFLDARVRPEAGCAERLFAALDHPGVDAATSYFSREDGGGDTRVVTPLGASLETGWRQNTFGGPCFAANPQAFAAIASATVDGAFAFWPAYAAMACQGKSLAVVPVPLYTVAADALQIGGHAEMEAVIQSFHSRMPSRLDLGWILKSAFREVSVVRHEPLGRALYDRFISIPDDLLAAYTGLVPGAEGDALLCDFAHLHERLGGLVARWGETEPRVFVYGTGQHSRLIFALCPALGRFVEGFIDRHAVSPFLGKPCVTPEMFRDDMADAVVYSSREFEHEMYARIKDARVEHALLYGTSPPAPSASIRLQNRFGHAQADRAALQAMYRPPPWATGYVSGADAEFLADMVAAHQPRTIVELGVAAGASSAVLLYALDQLPLAEARALYSCDVRPTCYFDEAYETGQACREMYPEPRARWHREFEMDARGVRTLLPAASVDLTFIDANHSHPWPLLDLLHVSAFAKPGSWVVLHDVDLPIHHPEHQVFGPRWLFQAWPFNKVKGVGQWVSIAAVQLPDDPARLVPTALSLLTKPWEQAPSMRHVALPPAFAAVRAALEARLNPAGSVCAAS